MEYSDMDSFHALIDKYYTNSQKIENPDHIPEKCVVCISPKEVLITDEDRHVLLKLKYLSF